MPIFRSLDLERMLIYQEFLLWKSAILHSIKLPFDVQAAEKSYMLSINYGSVWLEDSTVELEREEEMKRNTCILQWVQKIV